MEGIPRQEKIKSKSEILDGKCASGLLESHTYTLASGDELIAGTFVGFNHAGEPNLGSNQDRCFIVPQNNFFGVIDGIGGQKNGEKAAEILAKNFSENFENSGKAIQESYEEIKNLGDGGAVFMNAKVVEVPDIINKKFITFTQAGDARAMIIRKNEIFFQSEDQSTVQELVERRAITKDQALYDSRRNEITAAVSQDIERLNLKYYFREVEDGDIVILGSDGIFDNLTPEEIAEAQDENKFTIKQLYTWISNEVEERMKNSKRIIEETENRERDGKYSDRRKSKPKPDNCSLAICKIKK